MLLYAMLALCALLIGLLVYRYDLHDREPWQMLLLAVVMGAGGMFLAGRVQVLVLRQVVSAGADVADFNLALAASAAVTEELAKLAVVWIIALGWRRQFNDPMDGLIYGSFAGLGCAIEEAVYLYGWPHGEVFLPLQEPIRLLGHLVMGGIGGFAVGLWRVRFMAWPVAVPAGWAAAVGIHFVWDVIALSAGERGQMLPWHTAGAVATMFSGLFLYALLVRVGFAMSQRTFAPQSRRSLLGWPFVRGGRPRRE